MPPSPSHNNLTRTPIRIGVLAGAKIRATEAERTSQIRWPAFGSRSQGRLRNDVSQVGGGLCERWKAPRWRAALPLRPMR
jgi:hypothetical protein